MTVYAPPDPCVPGWRESAPGQVHPGIPGSGSPGRPGSYCPSAWTEDFDRAQMSTQVIMGRQSPSDVPTLRYVFPSDNGAVPPPAGEFSFDADQESSGWMFVSKTDDLGVDATIWLNYLHYASTITIQTLASTKEQRSYFVTGEPIEDATGYFAIPISWTQGTTDVPHGPIDMTLQLGREIPIPYQDTYGVEHYGRMVYNRTDLISTDRSKFETLADHILEIRGSNSVPRIDTVTLDARTGWPGHNMALMSQAAPERPSRYFCCMNVDGRRIFHRMMFATSVRHHIVDDEWTLVISLDLAEWAGVL
jgi:hypothetical protein